MSNDLSSVIQPSELTTDVTQTTDHSWVITLQTDPETGDLVIPLTQEILEQSGFDVGDVLTWAEAEPGVFTVSKKY
jgi:hypothetical protein